MHLVDGTFELFRHFYAVPSARDGAGHEVGAVRGVLNSVRAMIDGGATHLGVATDYVIESFRNHLWPAYKTGEGIDPLLWSQFRLLEESLDAMGVRVWPMVEFEADDALASAAAQAALDPRVAQVLICSPDKDLAQCVRGTRVVQVDRLRRTTRDEAGVIAKFGVPPASIPDYLALVGDSADGYPGLQGWGAKSAAAVLAAYRAHRGDSRQPSRLDASTSPGPAPWPLRSRAIGRWPCSSRTWPPCAIDVPVFATVDDLAYRGPRPEYRALRQRLDAASTTDRPERSGR